MNIFDATLKLKDHTYKGNPQLLEIEGEIELSAFNSLPFLYYENKIKSIKDYIKRTKKIGNTNFMFDLDFYVSVRNLKSNEILIRNLDKLSPDSVNTKEYWNFLHENFPFCDVATYYNVTDLKSYFSVKGKHYNAIIDKLGIDFFKNKKILEIGPGYGYLPTFLKTNHIRHKYYCADLVKRFNHKNFIEVNGYNLNINDKFDVIVMVDVIQHLGINILKTYLAEIQSMLNPNGSLILGVECPENTYFMPFFGQLYKNMGIQDIKNSMMELNFNIEPEKQYFRNGKILEFKQNS